ncbi:MAG TPA: hypothetical protein VFD22_04255 [Gemmatimonadaceae bacterium]|nr:hypothetical protein [Gemmatimonadaceae bacterium]
MNRVDRIDALVAASKGVFGALPIVGPLLAEAIGVFIPNQRIDRLEAFLLEIEKRFVPVEQATVEAAFKDPEFIDILEDSFVQAAKSLSQERREYIASLVANSLSEEELYRIEQKRLLALLGDLNDVEILILRAKGELFLGKRQEFEMQHPETARPLIPYSAPETERNRQALYDSYVNHLIELGLIKPRYSKPWRGQDHKFDYTTGTLEASGYQVTQLGTLLLRLIGLSSQREA